jgi:Complement Clr-like EGF-like
VLVTEPLFYVSTFEIIGPFHPSIYASKYCFVCLRVSVCLGKCIDRNECQPPGLCSQFCIDVKHSYKCQCDDGYVLMPDHHNCRVDSKNVFFFMHVHKPLENTLTSGYGSMI